MDAYKTYQAFPAKQDNQCENPIQLVLNIPLLGNNKVSMKISHKY